MRCGSVLRTLSIEEDMDQISFKVNGIQYNVGSEVKSTTTLLEYLRRGLCLTGTKYNCLIGRCGACMVLVSKGPGEPLQAVNACLIPIASCHKWTIITIEAIGNRHDGYHSIQKMIRKKNGSQCGYCTPGWVVALFALLQGKDKLSSLKIEKSLTSNICRCTGYRPILDAAKLFSKDAQVTEIMDIEDMNICKKNGVVCNKEKCEEVGWHLVSENDVSRSPSIKIKMKDGVEWYRVEDLEELFNIFKLNDDNYLLANGNTAKALQPITIPPSIIIDISPCRELKTAILSQNLSIGGGMTITEMAEVFEDKSNNSGFSYLKEFNNLLQYIAHIPIQNIGTVAGNLMISYKSNNKLTTDLLMMFETVGAEVTLLDKFGTRKTLKMLDFLKEDMRKKIILCVLLPPLSKEYKVGIYKISGKPENAGTAVNAGFLYKLNSEDKVLECRIMFGYPGPFRAVNTERYLKSKKLFKNETLQGAVIRLNNEIILTDSPPATSPKYRKHLCIAFFYKSILAICPPNIVDSRFRSGRIVLRDERPVSKGRQTFETDESLWPLTQDIPKVEGMIQSAGEAPYCDDIPPLPREVFAVFVVSTIAVGKIESIDASKAMELPGVVAFYTAKDIPGDNSFTSGISPPSTTYEQILCDGNVKYFNQPIGIIAAETQLIAEEAAKLVVVKYSSVQKPVLNVKEAKDDPKRTTLFNEFKATEEGKDISKVIKGDMTLNGQYHACMETLLCVTKPTEEGLQVNVATQFTDVVQLMTSRALNIPRNKIDVIIRRVGGSFGYKISRSAFVALACNLVAYKLHRPCRIVQSVKNNMRIMGKRLPNHANYEIAVDTNGVIQYNNYYLYEDNGHIVNEPLAAFTFDCYFNCYKSTRWNYKVFNTVTDTASNTWCRSPGNLECVAMAEYMMENISYTMGMDPIEVRLANLDTEEFEGMKEMIDKLKNNCEYAERRANVHKFNKENRWKKRGLRLSCMAWNPFNLPHYFNVDISVYFEDGTVALTHGGIEMGQGINTKAVQICAHLLKIDVDKIQVKTTDTTNSSNNFVSGASATSASIGLGTMRACQDLLKKLDPIRAEMDNPSWVDLVKKAFESGVDLKGHGFVNIKDNYEFHAQGVACAEVEIDVLTGENEILRVDLIEDAGRSVSPGIDIGQIEGGFIMGLGYWTTENLVYNQETGELLTDSFNQYWVPQARDIPQDFRIYLREKSYSHDNFMGAKATGEAAISLAVVIPIAIREALVAARSESGISSTEYFKMDGPCTVEKICLMTTTDVKDFKLY